MLFRNMVRKYHNAAGGDGGAGGAGAGAGEGGAGAGGSADAGAGGAGAGLDYAKLAAELHKLQGQGQGGQGGKGQEQESAFDRIRREQQERENQGTSEQRIRSDVAFDLGFNKLVDDNKGAFGLDAETIRRGVGTGLDGSKQVEQLKVTAAKAFFSIEANLAMLSPADRAVYDQQIKGRHDAAIDAGKTWEIVERALHIKSQLEYQNKLRGGQQGGDNKGKMPMMDAYLQRCIARCRPKTNQ